MQKTLFAKCSVERKEEHRIITRIIEEDGVKYVEKTAVGKAANTHVEKMLTYEAEAPYLTEGVRVVPCEKIEDGRIRFPYIEGQRLDKAIDEAAKQKKWDVLWEKVRLLRDIIMNVKETETFERTPEFDYYFGDVVIPEEWGSMEQLIGYTAARNVNIDMVAANIILADDIYVLDYEWRFDFPLPLKWILFRSIMLNGTLTTLPAEQREKLLELVEISREEEYIFSRMEEAFQRKLSGVTLYDLYLELPDKHTIVREENYRVPVQQEPHRSIPYRAARKVKRMIVSSVKRD